MFCFCSKSINLHLNYYKTTNKRTGGGSSDNEKIPIKKKKEEGIPNKSTNRTPNSLRCQETIPDSPFK